MGYTKGNKRTYKLLAGRNEYENKTCQGPECTKPAKVHFLCNSHYYQVRRGKTLTAIKVKAFS